MILFVASNIGKAKTGDFADPKSKYNRNNLSILDEKRGINQREKDRQALWRAMALAITLGLVTIAFEWKSLEANDLVDFGVLDADFEELQDIPVTIQEPPPPPKQVTPPEIIEVPDEEEIREDLEVNLDVEITEETAIEEVVFEEMPQEEESDEIFLIVEETATPVGGMTAFYAYFAKNLVYPVPARQAGIEGKVYLQFVVDKNGNVSDVKVVKGIGFGCDEEAMRVIKKGPKWNPARQRGRAVKSRVTFPLHFKLS